MENFRKLLAKKKADGQTLDPMQSSAKSAVLNEMMGGLDGMGADKLRGLKKVTVASNSPTGLEKGLATAQQIVKPGSELDQTDEGIDPSMDGDDDQLEDSNHADGNFPDPANTAAAMDTDQMSPDELQEHIAQLTQKLQDMKMM